jgi:hypothetical protein
LIDLERDERKAGELKKLLSLGHLGAEFLMSRCVTYMHELTYYTLSKASKQLQLQSKARQEER